MNTPHPFPAVVDSSMLATFKQCPQLFKKQYIECWKPKDQSVHLHAGGAFAKGIEVAREAFYVQNFSAEDSVAMGMGALLKAYGDFQCPADSAKSAERMAGAYIFYFDNYPLTNEDYTPIVMPSGKRGIEFSAIEPLPIQHPETGDPLLYSGRMDALLNFAGGTYITDEKTTTSLGATWSRQWELRSQFTGYAWLCRQNGIKANGVIVRGVSILKTKYETQQAVSHRPDWQIDRWLAELQIWINNMIWCWQNDSWVHNLDHACSDFGGCSFRQACQTNPDEAQSFLTDYFERRHWDPVTRVETKL